jgi:tetratricopeptide (TPR) repeat protein
MPIRRPRGPKPVLRHVAFLELMAHAPEGDAVHRGSQASFLTLRLLENWIALGADLATPVSSAHRAACDAVSALSDDDELRAALGSVTDAIAALQEPDPQPVLPRVYALGKLYEQRGLMPQAADVYSTVARYVDSSVHLDLAYDAHMRHGFCLRNAGEFEWADQAYTTAGSLAARARDRVRVLTSRVGLAKNESARGNLPAAEKSLEELQCEADKLAATRLVALIMHDRAAVARHRGDIAAAVRLAFESFRRTSVEYDRERVLGDLATFLMLLGAHDTARVAFQLMELGTKSEQMRYAAQIGLMELAVLGHNETLFTSYRLKLAGANLHATARTSFLLDSGRGFTVFGRLAEARTALNDALALAESIGQSQRVFQIEEALSAVDAAMRSKAAQKANRPELVQAPDDIATALEELLLEVTAGAA